MACRLSLVAVSGGSLFVEMHIVVTSLVVKHGLRTTGSAVVAQRLSCSVAM